MSFIKSLISAFSMYTIIPVPAPGWDEGSRKYMLGFFPATGLLPAAALYFLFFLRRGVAVFIPNNIFYMAGAILPTLLTGGIHMDGLMDTCDAIGSHAPAERKLEIMKDSRCGAFGVMGLVVYYIAYMCALSLIMSRRQVLMVCAGFVLSRAMSALALLTMPSARKDGLSDTIVKGSGWKVCIVMLYLWVAAATLFIVYIYGKWGVAVIIAGLLFFYGYETCAAKEFGGLTGDLAGWFLCMYEFIFALLTGIIGYFWFL